MTTAKKRKFAAANSREHADLLLNDFKQRAEERFLNCGNPRSGFDRILDASRALKYNP